MVNKKNWLGSFVIMLIWGIALVYPAKVGADDLWANVPNLDMLNGIWKGSYNQSQTFAEVMIEGANYSQQFNYRDQSYQMDAEERNQIKNQVQQMFGDVMRLRKSDITITINSNAKTVSISGTNAFIYSGGNINTAWEKIKPASGNINTDDETVKVNDANHSVTRTYFRLKSYEDTPIRFQINQDGTKLKIVFVLSPDIKDMIFPLGIEIIMTKQ